MMDLAKSWYLLYYLGLMACGAVGYKNTRGQWDSPIIWVAGMGGGATRDVVFRWSLACLSISAIPDICVIWLGALLQAMWGHKRVFRACMSICDSFGVATFFILGVSVAQNHGCGPIDAFMAGSVTALMGGVWSGVLAGQHMRDIFVVNVPYRLITIAATAFYTSAVYGGADPTDVQDSVILCTGVSNLVVTKGFWDVVRSMAQQQALLMDIPEYVVILTSLQARRRWTYALCRVKQESVFQQRAWCQTRYHCIQPV